MFLFNIETKVITVYPKLCLTQNVRQRNIQSVRFFNENKVENVKFLFPVRQTLKQFDTDCNNQENCCRVYVVYKHKKTWHGKLCCKCGHAFINFSLNLTLDLNFKWCYFKFERFCLS